MILIAGFPYVRESYFSTFHYWPEKNGLFFLLPRIWKAKSGKVIFRPPKESNVITAKALFYHSHYPFIGGLLKGWMLSFPLILRRLKKQSEIKLVYACSEPSLLSTFYFNFWSKLFGLKCLNFTWDNIPYWEKFHGLNRLVKKFIIKANLSLCDGIVCGNAKGKEIFLKLTQKPIAVIPMSGVDAEIFQKKDKGKKFDEHDWTGKIVFTFAGAIGYRKGVHLIIEAFKRTVARITEVNLHLVIVGSGEYEKEIENLIQNSGIAEKITRIPWIDNAKMPRLFEASDVFLYPSISYGGWEEQFGYSMAEASLMRLPVIATHSGSIEEVVINNSTGILIEPGNTVELADAMMKLAGNKSLRELLGRAGREHILKNFSHQVVAEKFYNFFKKII